MDNFESGPKPIDPKDDGVESYKGIEIQGNNKSWGDYNKRKW